MNSVKFDYFTYEFVEHGTQNTIYRNCTITRDFDNYKKGQRVDSIIVQISFHIWQADEYIDEVTVFL